MNYNDEYRIKEVLLTTFFKRQEAEDDAEYYRNKYTEVKAELDAYKKEFQQAKNNYDDLGGEGSK